MLHARTRSLFEQAHDALTVTASVVDVVWDILVTIEFYRAGHQFFFRCSILIFLTAQFCYAFLFTYTHAQHKPILIRVAVFLAILPFAQLVPTFTWLESFDIPVINNSIQSLGLKSAHSTGSTDSHSLWGYMERKYRSHAGFLVEAVAEALPQAMLQICFICGVTQTPSMLSLVSVGLSVLVLSSKGILISYALHRPTMRFNFLCCLADVLCIFATTAWLAHATPCRARVCSELLCGFSPCLTTIPRCTTQGVPCNSHRSTSTYAVQLRGCLVCSL